MTPPGTDAPVPSAVVGCGRIGADAGPSSSRIRSHAEAHATHDDLDLVAVCDPDPARREQARKRWGADEAYADSAEMATAEDLSLVSVATPADARPKAVASLLETDAPDAILLEKPLATGIPAARDLVERLDEAGTVSAVNHIRRFPPAYRSLIDAVRDGDLGDVHHARVLYGKGIRRNGVHALDLLRALFDDPDGMEVLGGDDASDPTLDLLLDFPGGTRARLAGVPHEDVFPFEVDLVTSEGRVTLDDQGHRLVRRPVLESEDDHGFRRYGTDGTTEPTDLEWATRYALDDLLEVAGSGREPVCTLEDGVRALELAREAIDRHERTNPP